jgi:hypothetical protein
MSVSKILFPYFVQNNKNQKTLIFRLKNTSFLVNFTKVTTNNILLYEADTVSVWLLFNANSAFFQLYHGENKLIFNEMMMKSTLY